MMGGRVKEKFSELSPSEFFYRNREIAGFTNPSRALYSCCRELLENSLDACELHDILPDIYMNLLLEEKRSLTTGIYRLRVQDNGSGVPEKEILKAFGRVFYSSKYVLRQARGTFGLGGTLALLYGQITTHKPIKVISSDGGNRIVSISFIIDIEKNIPQILEKKRMENPGRWRGTIVEFSLLGNYYRVSNRVISYLKQTAVVAPYAELKFVDPRGKLYFFRRTTEDMPRKPQIVKPHPHGVDVEMLKKLVNQGDPDTTLLDFMKGSFHRVGDKIARRFLRYAGIPWDTRLADLSMEDMIQLSKNMQSFDGFLPPSKEFLSPIGEKLFLEGIKKEYNPAFAAVITRPSSSYLGHSFIVEAGIAYGGGIPGERGEIRLFRYANKIPLLFDEGSDVSQKIINDINWSYYKRPTDGPISFFIHICSTKVPFRSLGKEFIADVPEVEREIRISIRTLLRNLTSYTKRMERRRGLEKRLSLYQKYLPKIAEFSARLSGRKEPPKIDILMEKVKKKYEGKKIEEIL